MKFVLKSLVVVVLLCFPLTAFAYDYKINSYQIDINVNENNVLDITEKMNVYFDIDKHGIFRKIPLKNKVERLDGTTSYNRVKISNILVSEPATAYNEGGYKVIKIGDPNVTLTGLKDYVISYSYNLGKDTGKGYDELYFNLIGEEWDTTINNVSFTINMPKEFDESKIGFSRGYYKSTDNSNIKYTVNGNKISGNYDGILNPGEALTIRLELPEGYFVGASNNYDLIMLLAFALPILFAIISLFLWYKYGNDNEIVETVEFYPPEGFNSAEVGFLYNGKAVNKDVVSLIVYLANKGYLKIIETEEKVLFTTRKDFKLIKLKEYDGDNTAESIFLSGLFKTKDEVSSDDLRYTFYTTMNEIIRELNKKENKHTIFEKMSLKNKIPIMLMILISFILITIKPVSDTLGASAIFMAVLFPGIGFAVMFPVLFSKSNFVVKIFITLWGIGFGFIPLLTMVLPGLLTDNIYFITYVVGIICIVIMSIILKYMPKRTKYGNELLGKIKGFKHFLEVAEKPQLESLVMQNPTYFYDILPFTYVLDVSEKWIKKFETIASSPPQWYEGSDSFSVGTFGGFMSSTMTSATSVMASSPSSGGSSGGGSSGGGSGGGGGGSW